MPHHAHDHSHAGHGHHHAHDDTRSFGWAFALNLGFALVEFVGGVLTGSVAILSDAVHDLGDATTLGVAWGLERLSGRGRRGRYSYGYRRLSLLSALLSALVLVTGSLLVLWEAVPRLFAPTPVYTPGMLGLAVLGVLVNGLAAHRLHGSGSMNARITRWHLLEDLFGWIAVLVGACVMLLFDAPWIDPLLAIGLSVFVLFNVVRNGRETLALFLQAAPEGVDLGALDASLGHIDGVASTHHTHVWSLDGTRHVLTTHLVVPDAATRDDLVRIKRAAKDLAEGNGFAHLTVELEFACESCEMREDERAAHR